MFIVTPRPAIDKTPGTSEMAELTEPPNASLAISKIIANDKRPSISWTSVMVMVLEASRPVLLDATKSTAYRKKAAMLTTGAPAC